MALPACPSALLPDLSHEKEQSRGIERASERAMAVIVRYDLTGDFPPFPAPSALRTGGSEGRREGVKGFQNPNHISTARAGLPSANYTRRENGLRFAVELTPRLLSTTLRCSPVF